MKKLNKVEKDVKQELTVDLVMKLCTRRTDHLQELRSEIVDSQSQNEETKSEQSKSTEATLANA